MGCCHLESKLRTTRGPRLERALVALAAVVLVLGVYCLNTLDLKMAKRVSGELSPQVGIEQLTSSGRHFWHRAPMPRLVQLECPSLMRTKCRASIVCLDRKREKTEH